MQVLRHPTSNIVSRKMFVRQIAFGPLQRYIIDKGVRSCQQSFTLIHKIRKDLIVVNAIAFIDLGVVNLFSVTFLKRWPVPIKNDFS